jgi:pimeloyl-ACP methyl ester carboxylesterase
MTRFRFTGADGTPVTGWRNGGDGPPVVIANGLGTPPAAWPTLIRPGSGFRVSTWYYRGTAGGGRPHDPARIRIVDHVDDCIALMDHEGIDRAVLACWSLGVNVGFEAALRHPDRVAGLLAVAGVPGGTFQAMFEPLRVPRRLRHRMGVGAARLGRRIAPALDLVARVTPVNRVTATVINHSGFILPRASTERLMPTLAEFRDHDFGWYFSLALAAADHAPVDVSKISVPTTMVAGKWDVLTSAVDMARVAGEIPGGRLSVLDGSHFLPLEFPDELVEELRRLLARCRL